MPPKAKKAATTATTKTNTPTNDDKNDKQNDTTMTDTPAPAAAVVAKKTKTTKTATPEPVVEEKKAEIVQEKKADVAPVAKKGKKAVVEEKAAPVVEEKKVETPAPAAKKSKKAAVEEKPAPVVVEEKKEEPKKVETPAPAAKSSKAATKKAAAAAATTTTTAPVLEEKPQEKQQQSTTTPEPTTMTDATTTTADDAAPTKLSKNAAKKLKRQAAIAEKSLDAIEEVTIQSKIAEQTAAMDNTKKTPLWLATDDLRKAIRDGIYEEKGKKRALAIAQNENVATKKTKLNDTTAKTTAGGEKNNGGDDDDDSDDEDTFNKNTDYGDDMIDVDEAGHQLVALTPALIKAAAVRTRDDDIMDDLVQQQREKHYLRRPIGGVGDNKKTEEEEAEEKEKLERTVFLSNVPTIAKEKDIKDFLGRDIPIQSMRQRLAGFQDQKLPHWAALAKGQFHEKRDTLSWFVVLKNKSDMAQVLKLNQNVLLEKHIRVDAAAGEAKIDHTRAVFVGNLPYEVQEESLYQIFSKCGKIHAVRCLRDAKTGMGRGTAFVQFTDRVYVPEALKLNHKKFEQIGGRSIRVDRVAAQAYEKAPAFMLQLSKQRIMNEKRQKLEKLQGRSAKLRAAIMNVVDEPKAKVNTQGTYQKTFGLAAAGTKLKKPRHNMEGRTPKAPAPSWQGAAAKPSDKLGRNKASSTAKNAKDKKIKALKK